MVTTRRHNHPQRALPPTCDHCGNTGHISSICPRSAYLPKMPALRCTACIFTCRSGYEDEPDSNQIVVTIDPCILHSSPVVRPSRPNTAPRSAQQSTSGVGPPPPIVPGVAPPPPIIPAVAPPPLVAAAYPYPSSLSNDDFFHSWDR